jgi:hypothetical protein
MRCLTTYACDKAVTKCKSLSAVACDGEAASMPAQIIQQKA